MFAGGGVRGIALAGAAAGAMDVGYAFRELVGSSAGALVAAGYGADELGRAVCRLDWPALADPVPGARIPLLGPHLALLLHRGIHRGDRLETVWTDLLAAQGVRTFGDLPPGALRVMATDLSHERGAVLPDDLGRYGHDPETFPVSRAVRMSATVPFVFRPVPLVDPTSGERSLLVDGALAANFPIRVLEPGPPTVGFRLVDPSRTHPHRAVRGPASLAAAVMAAAIRAPETLPLSLPPGTRLVEVPVSRDSLDFRLSPDEARALFDEGRRVARRSLTRTLSEIRHSSDLWPGLAS